MTRHTFASLAHLSLLAPLAALPACSSAAGAGDGQPPCTGSACADGGEPLRSDASKTADGPASHKDGATTADGALHRDGGASSDGSHPHDGASSADSPSSHPDGQGPLPDGQTGMPDGGSAVQGACSAGAVRCSPGNLVESCNSSGTAWLFDQACASGCSAGLCTGACTAGATRCSGTSSETCNAAGTAFGQATSCTTFCSDVTGACAVSPVEVTTNTNMDGVVVVDGDFVVFPNATLTSPTGNLTIYAKTITVQQGGSIVVSPTGQNPQGAGAAGYWVGTGGGYGTSGAGGADNSFGSSTDSDVAVGSAGGGPNPQAATAAAGLGGGVLRLFASTITIAGQVTANGQAGASGSQCYSGAGGGSGGGVLIAGDSVTVSGAVSALGGPGGSTCDTIVDGGQGRIKVLSGSQSSVTGSLSGAVTQGLLPPLPLTSTTHPDPTQVYNDNFPSFDFSWGQPFPSVQGYYLLGTTSIVVPSPANAQFSSKEFISLPEFTLPGYDGADGGVDAGPGSGAFTFYFQAVSIGATSNVGSVETVFPIHINATAPSVASSSHPDPMAWSSNQNPYFSWTFPVPDTALSASYYVFDHYGDTVPGTGATLIPITQKNQLLSNVTDGIWVFHLISQDTRGYFTKVAGNYRVNIGADPGVGSLVGQVVSPQSQPVAGATVTVNRGIYTTTTNSSGTYNFSQIPVASWEVTATSAGQTATATGVVTSGGTTTTNLTL